MTAQAQVASNLVEYLASTDGGKTFFAIGAFADHESALASFKKEHPFIDTFSIGQQGLETRMADLIDEDDFRWMLLEKASEVHGETGVYITDEFLAKPGRRGGNVLQSFKKWLNETDQDMGGMGLGAVINTVHYKNNFKQDFT